ncbi:MAG: hypothetical protein JO164_01855, partial [Candidatus Eremiobacteraeota bacterium]|nr:hypothetical protein [Candidatus Eremiobacteraeota bacterium]
LQRTVEWKAANHPNATLDAFTAALNTAVQTAATLALQTPDSLPGTDGYTALWKETALIAKAVRDGTTDDNGDAVDANDPAVKAALAFVPARYGYAIEAHASAQTDALQAALPAGYSFALQASRGMTRPDIVVANGTGAEVGWFDITSVGSRGHIDLKTGTSWQTKTYVAEITYPAFDISALDTGAMSIGQRVALRGALRRRKQAWAALVNAKKTHFRDVWVSYKGTEQTSKSQKKIYAKFALSGAFPRHEVTDGVAKSLLRSFDLLPRNYGFEAGGSRSDGDAIIREYQEA